MPQKYKIALDTRMAPNKPKQVFYICIHLENTNLDAKWVVSPECIRTANISEKQDTQFYKGQKTIENKTARPYEFTAALHEAKFYNSSGHAKIMLKTLNTFIPDGKFSMKSTTLIQGNR